MHFLKKTSLSELYVTASDDDEEENVEQYK